MLRERGEARRLDDLVAESVLRIVQASTRGDLDAARWIVETFWPVETGRLVSRPRLPSPTSRPLAYLDALSRAARKGEMSTADAARLANLARPFAADEQLREIAAELESLREQIAALRRPRAVS